MKTIKELEREAFHSLGLRVPLKGDSLKGDDLRKVIYKSIESTKKDFIKMIEELEEVEREGEEFGEGCLHPDTCYKDDILSKLRGE